MGRPPKVTDGELVGALKRTLDWPDIAAVETTTVATELGVNQQTVRNRLKAARTDDGVPVGGSQTGQGGWFWWLTDDDLY